MADLISDIDSISFKHAGGLMALPAFGNLIRGAMKFILFDCADDADFAELFKMHALAEHILENKPEEDPNSAEWRLQWLLKHKEADCLIYGIDILSDIAGNVLIEPQIAKVELLDNIASILTFRDGGPNDPPKQPMYNDTALNTFGHVTAICAALKAEKYSRRSKNKHDFFKLDKVQEKLKDALETIHGKAAAKGILEDPKSDLLIDKYLLGQTDETARERGGTSKTNEKYLAPLIWQSLGRYLDSLDLEACGITERRFLCFLSMELRLKASGGLDSTEETDAEEEFWADFARQCAEHCKYKSGKHYKYLLDLGGQRKPFSSRDDFIKRFPSIFFIYLFDIKHKNIRLW